MSALIKDSHTPRRVRGREGSALIVSLWTIALLSLLVMSFALDALLEGKINVYVKQRRRVDYLTQSGIAIAEVILLDFQNATSSSGRGTALEDDEEDRWLQAKLDLQRGSCTVDGYALDAENPEAGLVTVKINSADVNKWPINALGKSDIADQIWENVLNVIGLPMEYQEEVVDSFYDWIDADSTVTGRSGAESDYYDGLNLIDSFGGQRLNMPRNGPLLSVAELEMIRGIRDHPAIFHGGVLREETQSRFKQDEVRIHYGLKAFFDIYGESPIINVNSASIELLMTVPGIDGDELLAGAIVEERKTGANMAFEIGAGDAESLLFKDWEDLNSRIPGGVNSEASPFLVFQPQKHFEIVVTGEAGGVSHQIKAIAVVEGDRVRYLRWREDP